MAPHGWQDYFDPSEPIETEPIIDCTSPFGLVIDALSPRTLQIQGSQVVPGSVITIDTDTVDDYQVSNVFVPGMYYNVILFRHEGPNYRYIDIAPLVITESDYRTLAAAFFTNQADIDTYVARIMSSDPWSGLEYGTPESDTMDAFDRYVQDHFVPRNPPLAPGTYTFVTKEHLLIQSNRFLTPLLRLAHLLLPAAEAATPDTYVVTFTITKAIPVPAGASSVLFLPGIMGSRLYEEGTACGDVAGEHERWFSTRECDHLRLVTNFTGSSINQIYTRAGESSVIDVATVWSLSFPLYQSFFSALADWKRDGVIADYTAVPYDWRMRLDDLLKAKLNSATGRITYDVTNNFEDGYLYQTVKKLVASSTAGKVTIVAHSNGGLLAKTFMATLAARHDPLLEKIDNVILVAVPQVGTPEALVGMLQGSEIGPGGLVVSQQIARQLVNTMPFSHHLLPNQSYFDGSGVTVTTPVIRFVNGTATAAWVSTYGETISNVSVMRAFLRKESGRAVPTWNDLLTPAVVDGNLFAYTNAIEQLMNNWIPSSTSKVYEIAGTGIETPAGLVYYTGTECASRLLYFCTSYKPALAYAVNYKFDGDGTVVVPSALAMSTSSLNIQRLWLDLKKYNNDVISDRVHKNIFEVLDIINFIKNTLSTTTSNAYTYLRTTEPLFITENRLVFTLHSPLDMSLKLADGAIVSSSTPMIGGAMFHRFGEVQSISLPDTTANKTLLLKGLATGSFTLDIEQQQNGSTTKRKSFVAIPSSTSTKVSLPVTDTSVIENLVVPVDYDGNGSVDTSYSVSGEVVTYATLRVAITALTLPSIYKNVMLATLKIAEKNQQKSLTNSQYKIIERVTLKILKEQVNAAAKLKLISVSNQLKIISMIDVLLSK